MSTQSYKFEFTLDQLNQILGCLGKQPYESVFMLINEIQKQAQQVMSTTNNQSE